MRLQDLVGKTISEIKSYDGMSDEGAHGIEITFSDGVVLEIGSYVQFDQSMLEIDIKEPDQ